MIKVIVEKASIIVKITTHLDQCQNEIYGLLRDHKEDQEIIAILMTESFFRPQKMMVLEFLFYRAMRLMNEPRAERVSLGWGQVQVRYWKNKVSLKNVLSISIGYDEVRAHWIDKNIITSTFEKKIETHVGEIRSHYYLVANQALDYVQKCKKILLK